MELRDLNVLHWRGARPAPTNAVGGGSQRDVFMIDTCQRRVAIFNGRHTRDHGCGLFGVELPDDGVIERFEGVDAFAFLLRFACGIESKLVAETEIFGQIKQAWREFSSRETAAEGSLARQLLPWIQLLFQDAKAVRAQHLAKLGSASYGSQVRRLLGEDAGNGPILLVGAGQLAQSVAPWLTGTELLICNRTPERAFELSRELAKRDTKRPVRVIEGAIEAELAAWRAVRHVILCVPPDEQLDARRIAVWGERTQGGASGRGNAPSNDSGGRIVHLGLGSQTSAWHGLPELVSLGALFEMLQMQSELRRRQIERARRACLEKALLRSLGASSSHPHSWEDLTAFHCL